MALNLKSRVVEFLQNRPGQKFTARDIATWIFKNYPDECRKKQERSTATKIPLDNETALITQLVAEISSIWQLLQKQNRSIKTTGGRPRNFYFTVSTDSQEIDDAESNESSPVTKANGPMLKESDLYPILSEFLWSERKIYSKRIDEKRSSNSTRGARWQ